jgi:hypothetical protein
LGVTAITNGGDPLSFTLLDAVPFFKPFSRVTRKRAVGRRPKHKAVFEIGAQAQVNFAAGMKALLSPKTDKKRSDHGHGR